ncbi:hypothetical protein GGX14DRAFT_390934 [Mycena pura]|uniref:Uncharacterized protein n=1 Tax=Mycena pura TaxID=153505 RepID=A0AAD6YFI4_9AGAR|nr:hypothetical protein GGX14DRAFT_390934 [Mycena pura]
MGQARMLREASRSSENVARALEPRRAAGARGTGASGVVPLCIVHPAGTRAHNLRVQRRGEEGNVGGRVQHGATCRPLTASASVAWCTGTELRLAGECCAHAVPMRVDSMNMMIRRSGSERMTRQCAPSKVRGNDAAVHASDIRKCDAWVRAQRDAGSEAREWKGEVPVVRNIVRVGELEGVKRWTHRGDEAPGRKSRLRNERNCVRDVMVMREGLRARRTGGLKSKQASLSQEDVHGTLNAIGRAGEDKTERHDAMKYVLRNEAKSPTGRTFGSPSTRWTRASAACCTRVNGSAPVESDARGGAQAMNEELGIVAEAPS